MINRVLIAAAALLTAALPLSAQNGAYNGFSPYSVYGVGDLHPAGTAYNASMGGVGIATRNKRFVNTMNPASVTARDSLSVMADFGVSGKASLFTQGDLQSTKTIFNINDFVLSFPMWRRTAFMVGIQPFSDTGFSMSYLDKITSGEQSIGYTGNRAYGAAGDGGLNQFFFGASALLWNRLSIGAQYNLYFGTISKYSTSTFGDASYRSQTLGDTLQVRAHTAKFGLQYEQPLSTKNSITFGATYTLAAPMRGNLIDYSYKNGTMTGRDDKTLTSSSGVYFGSEIGAGISFRNADRLAVEVDYKLKDWRKSGMDNMRGFSNNGESGSFTASMGHSVRAGFEFTPGRNDIRYYLRRCTYRAGAYYEQSYYRVDGKSIDAAGITLGMTLPVFRGYNGVSIGMDLGQRGFSGALVKERYFGFNLSMNVFDIWFQKPRYE